MVSSQKRKDGNNLSSAVHAHEIIRAHLKSSPLSQSLYYKHCFQVMSSNRKFHFFPFLKKSIISIIDEKMPHRKVCSLTLALLVHHPSLHFNLSDLVFSCNSSLHKGAWGRVKQDKDGSCFCTLTALTHGSSTKMAAKNIRQPCSKC